jgi:hypothetical protein
MFVGSVQCTAGDRQDILEYFCLCSLGPCVDLPRRLSAGMCLIEPDGNQACTVGRGNSKLVLVEIEGNHVDTTWSMDPALFQTREGDPQPWWGVQSVDVSRVQLTL